MLLISLMLAATPTPAIEPTAAPRRDTERPSRPSSAVRSKRLIELEAVVQALSSPPPKPARGAGPEGL